MGALGLRRQASLLAIAAAIAWPASAAAQPVDGEPGAVEGGAQAATQATAEPQESVEFAQEVTKTIVVTGSRIPRPNLTAVSPIEVVDQQEVKLQGNVAIEELLNQLPQVQPDQSAFVSNGATGTATVDLRGIGPARTLVLVNGRRLAPGDPSRPLPDLNMVPSTLIQRVELLTGGASSVYGSDAVSGVVNFILDTKLDGVRIDGQAGVFQHDNRNGSGLRDALIEAGYGYPTGNTVDGGRQDINIAAGTSFADGRAHVTAYAGYRHFDPLTQEHRDYSACTAQVDGEFDNNYLFCGGSGAAFPGNFSTRFETYQIGPGRTFEPGFDFFNFGPWNYYQRSDRRYTAGAFASADVSAGFNPFLEVMYLNDRSVAQIAPSASFGASRAINCDSPLLSEQQRDLVCFYGNYDGQRLTFDANGDLQVVGDPRIFTDPVTGATYLRGALTIGRRGVDTGPRQEDIRHETLRVLGGAKGDVGPAINYEASYLYARSDMSAAHLNDYSVTRLNRALDVVTDPDSGAPVCRSALIARVLGANAPGADADCVPWDIFALGQVTPEAAAYLNVPSFREGSITEQVLNGNATMNLGAWGIRSPWAEEDIQLNVGAEYRKDRLDYEPDERAQSGDLAGSGQDFPVHGSSEVKELFAEARIPLLTNRLVERLAVELGYRNSWYSNPDSTFTAEAYKVALDLSPVRGLRFRASQQRAVRAPNLVELFFPPQIYVFDNDRCAGATPQATQQQCAFTGVSAAQYGLVPEVFDPSGFGGYNATAGGNPGLQPETTKTQTLGAVLQPAFLPGFNVTIDWWNIDLSGAILQIGAQGVFDTCLQTGDPFFCDRIHRDSEGSLWLSPDAFVDDRLANVGAFKVRGIDVAVNYSRNLGRHGSADLSFVGTYVDSWTIDFGGLADAFDCAGKFGGDCGTPTPRWRHKARLTWGSDKRVSLSLAWRYWGSVTLKPFPDLPPAGPYSSRIGSQSYFDLATLLRVRDRFTLRLGVNNIFDKEPPLTPEGEGACSGGCNGNTYPGFYDPLGRFLFAGFTVSF